MTMTFPFCWRVVAKWFVERPCACFLLRKFHPYESDRINKHLLTFFFEIPSLHCYKSVRKKLVCDSLWLECYWFIDSLVPKPWIFRPHLGSLETSVVGIFFRYWVSGWEWPHWHLECFLVVLEMSVFVDKSWHRGNGKIVERVDRILDVVLKKQQACNTPHSAWWKISWMIETFDKCLKKERFYNRANIKIR